jgi:hypothetical protein
MRHPMAALPVSAPRNCHRPQSPIAERPNLRATYQLGGNHPRLVAHANARISP